MLNLCDEKTDDRYNLVTVSYTKGWRVLRLEFYPADRKAATITDTVPVPSFIRSLFFKSNSLSASYKKNEYLAIKYPYPNYRLMRSSIIYTYDKEKFIEEEKAASTTNDINNKTNEKVYAIEGNWFLVIK